MRAKSPGVRGWHWLVAVLLALVVVHWEAMPALAHGIGWDGDPSHLMEDLAVSFGLPMVVLLIGALAGIGLAQWMARRQPVDHQDATEGDEVIAQQRD